MTHRWRLESRRKKRRFSWPIGVVWTWRAGNILTTYIQPPCDLNVYCMYKWMEFNDISHEHQVDHDLILNNVNIKFRPNELNMG